MWWGGCGGEGREGEKGVVERGEGEGRGVVERGRYGGDGKMWCGGEDVVGRGGSGVSPYLHALVGEWPGD